MRDSHNHSPFVIGYDFAIFRALADKKRVIQADFRTLFKLGENRGFDIV